MKKILAIVAFLLAAPRALSQCKLLPLEGNSGLGCNTTTDQTQLQIYRGSSAPSDGLDYAATSGHSGRYWLDTSTGTDVEKECKAVTAGTCTSWQVISANVPQVYSSLASLPSASSAGSGAFACITALPCVWSNGTNWKYSTTGLNAGTGTYTETSYNAARSGTAAAPSVTTAASGTGNMTSGTHVFAVMYQISSGGLSGTGSATSSTAVSFNGSQQAALTGIATGGTGITARVLCASKANTSTPLYMIRRIADNSTTSDTFGTADANLLTPCPLINFTGDLPSNYTVSDNTSQTIPGGCGSDGTGIVCQAGANYNAATGGVASWVSSTAETTLRLEYRLDTPTNFLGSNYDLSYVVDGITLDGSTANTITSPMHGGLRTGGTNGALAMELTEAHAGNALSASAVLCGSTINRQTASAAFTNSVGTCVIPAATAPPYSVKIGRRNLTSISKIGFVAWYSGDAGSNWWPINVASTANTSNIANTTSDAVANTSAVVLASEPDRFVLNMMCGGGTCTQGYVIKIHGLTINAVP